MASVTRTKTVLRVGTSTPFSRDLSRNCAVAGASPAPLFSATDPETASTDMIPEASSSATSTVTFVAKPALGT